MSDLIAWLRAQLDEDERVAQAVEDRSEPWPGQWQNDDGYALRTRNGWVLAHNQGKPYAPGLVDHIARHDPARALAEVDAKRKILDLHKPVAITGNVCCADANRYPCHTVRLLAQPYAGRPGWREEWRA